MLDMHEARGSSPLPPTTKVARWRLVAGRRLGAAHVRSGVQSHSGRTDDGESGETLMSADENSGAQVSPGVLPAEEYFEDVVRGSAEELLDAGAHTELDAMRHSAAHVMAEAVLGMFPDAQLGIGPSIDDGFYYDFLLPRPLTPDDLAAVEAAMHASIRADHPFVRKEFPFEKGRAFFEARNQPFKVEILDDLAARAREANTALPPTSTFEHGPVS